jgi:hypothetical protein
MQLLVRTGMLFYRVTLFCRSFCAVACITVLATRVIGRGAVSWPPWVVELEDGKMDILSGDVQYFVLKTFSLLKYNKKEFNNCGCFPQKPKYVATQLFQFPVITDLHILVPCSVANSQQDVTSDSQKTD